MAFIFRRADSLDLFVQIALQWEKDPSGITEEVHTKVVEFLAEEFLKKHKDGILGVLKADDIAHKLNGAVAELVRRKLLEGTNEPA